MATNSNPGIDVAEPGAQGWLTGSEVCDLLAKTKNPNAAMADLDNAIMNGRVIAQPTSISYPRPKGPPIVEDGAPLTRMQWWRVTQLRPAVDIWTVPILSLPVGANDKAVDLIGLRVDAVGARALAASHGAIVAPAPVERDSGGRTSEKHGKPIARITIRLMRENERDLGRWTGESLADELIKEYILQGHGRPSTKNAVSISVGIIKAVREARNS